ncbi:MAG: isoprenylcysteine carboxylmethyltransferase family protein [Dokdonella sp.]
MNLAYANLIPALWLVWCVVWLISARGVKRDRREESPASRAAHLLPLAVAALLLWLPTLPGGFLCGRLWPATLTTYFAGVAIVALGLGFSIWARMHLGRNWSGTVTLKESHELIRSGPYALVRHPIYTGLLLGFVGSAVSRDEWRGVLAVAIVFLALWRKLRLEERWMIETFGDVYQRYRKEVPALVPFWFR